MNPPPGSAKLPSIKLGFPAGVSCDAPAKTEAEPQNSGNHVEQIEGLFRSHNEALVRFLTAKLTSREDALEVAQEAYVRMLGLEVPGAVSFLRSYLFRVASNLAVDRVRRSCRERAAREFPRVEDYIESRTPEREAIGEQQIIELRERVAELPPKCRQAFLLHRVHDFSIRQVAAKMGLSERMVRLYVSRALVHCSLSLAKIRGAAETVVTAQETQGEN